MHILVTPAPAMKLMNIWNKGLYAPKDKAAQSTKLHLSLESRIKQLSFCTIIHRSALLAAGYSNFCSSSSHRLHNASFWPTPISNQLQTAIISSISWHTQNNAEPHSKSPTALCPPQKHVSLYFLVLGDFKGEIMLFWRAHAPRMLTPSLNCSTRSPHAVTDFSHAAPRTALIHIPCPSQEAQQQDENRGWAIRCTWAITSDGTVKASTIAVQSFQI